MPTRAESWTLSRTVFVAMLGLECVVLAVAFAALDLLLAGQIQRDLQRQADEQLRLLAAAVSHHRPAGHDALVIELQELERQTGTLGQVSVEGQALFTSARLLGVPLANGSEAEDAAGNRFQVATTTLQPYRLSVAVPRGPTELVRGRLRTTLVMCFVLGLIVTWPAARWLSARASRPLEQLARGAESVDATTLHRVRPAPQRSYAEVQQLTSAFNRMLGRLDAAVGRLRQFTADASHELRTPLAIMKANAQVALTEPPTAERWSECLRAELRQIDRLDLLVEDLLLLARLDAGSVERDAVDLSDVVIETTEQMRPLAVARSVDLAVEPPVPTTLHGERRQLERLVRNLLDNAIRYTPVGGTVRVRLEREGEVARLTVIDSGSGIDAASLPQLFEPFVRADPSRARDTGGTGLGLAIARRIATAHQGTITVESTVGKGSTFAVRLGGVRS